MGDRGNIVVQGDGSKVFLYTHWTGSDLPNILKRALKRGESRWDDAQYLTRIIFCEMVGYDINGTTGFGISSVEGDGGALLTVNTDTQMVTDHKGRSQSIKQFVEG